jgi:hypothetical protein
MPILLKDDLSVLFVHIPKAGGSTLEQLFVNSGYTMHLRETRRGKWKSPVMAFRTCPPQHWQASLLKEMLAVNRFDLVFLTTREPIARFRSAYAMRHRQNPRADSASVEEWADRMFERYDRNPYALDNHLRPQHEFHLPGAEVYRLENGMDAMVADMNDRFGLGLSSDIPHAMNSTKRGLPSSEVQISPRLEERLRSFYAEDFKRYDYES